MKYVVLLYCFGFISSYAQEIDSAFYFNMNDSILKSNGVYAFENEFLVNKRIERKNKDCLIKIQQWSHPTISLVQDTINYYFISYDYDLKEFSKFSFKSILGINKNTGKLCYVYYEPDSYILFKNTKKEQWNKSTFNLGNIISIIESRDEVKFKSKKIMESFVTIEGSCKDIFFLKKKYYTLSLESSYRDNYKNSIEQSEFGVNYAYCTHNYYPLSILNSIEFIEVNFIFETEFQFFRPNKKKRFKKKTDYDVARFHQIKLSFSEHKVLSDGLFSTPSGVEY